MSSNYLNMVSWFESKDTGILVLISCWISVIDFKLNTFGLLFLQNQKGGVSYILGDKGLKEYYIDLALHPNTIVRQKSMQQNQ